MKKKYILLLTTISFLGMSGNLQAQAGELKGISLEKAIFLQENKKDYKAASNLLEKVIEKNKANQLEAIYRLAQCYKKLGNEEKYKATLKDLASRDNPENKWVKLAIEESPRGIKFLSGKWEDGDVFAYDLLLPHGKKRRFYTLIYDKLEEKDIWKVTTLRSYINNCRSQIVFNAENYQPIDEYWKFIDREFLSAQNQFDFDKTSKWDKETFHNDMLTTLAMVLPKETTKHELAIKATGVKVELKMYRTGKTKEIDTAVGKFSCDHVVIEIMGVNLDLWLNKEGKNELISLSQPGMNIILAEVSKRDQVQKKKSELNAFPYVYKSESCLSELVANNNKVYRSLIFPDESIYLARLEVNHTKNLLEKLRKDPVALAKYTEGELRNLEDDKKFELPENVENIILAGCKGVLYTTTMGTQGVDHKDHYVCFYGMNDDHAIFLRGLYKEGESDAARKEIKRILIEDLKAKQ